MNATMLINRRHLAKSLKTITGFVDPKAVVHTLRCVRLRSMNGGKWLEITGTDLDTWGRVRMRVENAIGDLATVVAAKQLLAAVTAAKGGEVRITASTEGTEPPMLLVGEMPFGVSLACGHTDEYPECPATHDSKDTPTMALDGNELRTGLAAVSLACGHDDYRLNLTGVLFECDVNSVTLVATDGHRLATFRVKADLPVPFVPFILPRNAVKRVLDKLKDHEDEVLMRVTKELVTFGIADLAMQARPTDMEFPKWRQVIPKQVAGWTSVTATTSHVAAACTDILAKFKIAWAGAKESPNVRMDETATLSFRYGGITQTSGFTCHSTDIVRVGLNARYLLDAMALFPSGEVSFLIEPPSEKLRTTISPVILQGDGSCNGYCIIMPVRMPAVESIEGTED